MTPDGSRRGNGVFRALLDRELTAQTDDAFGHQDFAAVLRSLVESAENEPPFSVGLLGRWGTGKSSIKGIYLSSLADDARNEGGKKRSERFRPITFNAWRYGGEDLKRALLRHVYLELGGKEPDFNDAVFNQMQTEAQRRRSLGELWRDFVDKFLFSTVQVIAMLVFLIVAFLVTVWLVLTIVPVEGDLARAAIVVVVAGLVGVLARPLMDWRRFVVPSQANLTRIELPASSAEQYETLLAKQLEDFKRGKTAIKRGKSCERIVVFVDDLDRLSAEEMVDGLDAIRTFMDIPRMVDEGPGVVFVVSCDEERVADALANRRKQRNAELPAAVFSRMDAHRYLDRIFQFRLEIPPLPRRDMREYAKARMVNELPEIAEELRERGVAVENVTERLVHVRVQDPRNVVHLLNTFSQSWWLARRREFEGAGTDRPGGLQEDAVTSHPVALAALCALRVDFPDFYKDLQHEPDLVLRFTEVFLRGADLDAQPEAVREILRDYARSGEDGREDAEVKPTHRPLRQYVSSLQGLRWPPTLQPLLLLAQDPITRRLGDKARPVYEAFVSGDTTGVLEALGHSADRETLSGEEVDLLRDLEEGLTSETAVRRDSAGAVLADLAGLLPEDRAGQLLGPLARRLADSPELRWRVGVGGMVNLFPRVGSYDRRELAGELVGDLLKTEGKTGFRLPSGEAPSLDEAMAMAEEACSLALDVREQDGLPEDADLALLGWLETRHVAVGDEEDAFGFERLEAWVSDHEVNLLQGLSGRYTAMLQEEMAEDNLEGIDVDAAIGRSRKVFDRLWETGQDSRAVLWTQLADYASVRSAEAVALSWEIMGEHPGAADPAAASAYIERLGERLLTRLDDRDNWDLDWKAGSEALVQVAETYRDGLQEPALGTLVKLDQKWGPMGSPDDVMAHLAVRLLEQLRFADEESANEVIEHWSGRALSALKDPCLDWLAGHFGDALDESQRAHLIQNIEAVCLSADITEDQSARYRRFVGALGDDTISSEEVQGHLGRVLNQLAQQQQSPGEYLEWVFPALAPLIAACPTTEAGAMLTNLFVSPRVQQPGYFGWLHGQMAEHWPTQDEVGTYDPQAVFTNAAGVAGTHPTEFHAPDLLRSMREMVTRGIIAETNTGQVLQTAAQLWPHHTDAALETILAFDVALDGPVVAGLATNVDLSDGETVEALERAWGYEAAAMSFDDDGAVAMQILSTQPQGTEGEPDLALRLWVGAGPERRARLLEQLLLDPDLNDGQRKRVWLQAVRSSEELGRDFILRVLPTVLGIGASPETHRSIIANSEAVTRPFPTQQEKNELSRALLESFAASPSAEIKNGLADWMQQIGGGAALRRLGSGVDLPEEDVQILARHFPRSGTLRSYRRRLRG